MGRRWHGTGIHRGVAKGRGLKHLAIRAAPAVFVCLWATGFIGARLGMPHSEPGTFLAMRSAIAFALLALLALATGARWPRGRAAWACIGIGALLHGLYLGGVFWAIEHGMPAGVAALVVGLQPVITAFLAAMWLGEEVTRAHRIGLPIGLAGVIMVLAPSFEASALAAISVATVTACTVSVFASSFGTVWQKAAAQGLDLRSATALQYLGGFVPPFLLYLGFETGEIDWTGEMIVAMVWAVLVLSLGAVFLLMWLIREGSVARVSSLFFLVPAVAALMAWGLFDERLTLVQIVGMAVCALGVALATRAPAAAGRG